MQYVQQGLLEKFAEAFSKDDILHWLIDFSSQSPNQTLAKEGSIKGNLATLDLSEASDRVSNQLVRGMLGNHPHLQGAVDACRSRKAVVPGHGVIRLAKFASMGSALTFPFESMVFATLVFLGIEKSLNSELTLKDIKSYKGRVRVYGDDIIVPVDFVPSVISVLETFGFRVNAGKSFWTGKFRESCGKDYYDGRDITITRVRSMLPSKRIDVHELVSAVSLRNHLFLQGFSRAVDYLDSLIGGLIPFPIVESSALTWMDYKTSEEILRNLGPSTSRVLGKLAYQPYQVDRVDNDLQIPLVKGVVVRTKLPVSRLDGYGALLKWYLKRSELPFADRNHLERSGRPVSVNTTTGWYSPY
jgi:hypothetical protein